MAQTAIDRIRQFIRAVRYIRDEFEPLGIPPRRIAQLDIVIMESEAELRRLLAAGGGQATEEGENPPC